MRSSSVGPGFRYVGVLIVLALSLGCVGQNGTEINRPSGSGELGGTGSGSVGALTCDEPGWTVFRRLTGEEYDNTLQDLLGDSTRPSQGFAADSTAADRFVNDASSLAVSQLLVEQMAAAAEGAASRAVSTKLATLVPCGATITDTCAKDFIRNFGLRAYRRPLATAEVDRLFGLYTAGKTLTGGEGAKTGVELVLSAMLQASSFLYRVEFGTGAQVLDNVQKVTPYELATRLSYYIWGSMPDAALFAAAAADQLGTPDQLKAQATRMLGVQGPDGRPKWYGRLSDFHWQWLKLEPLAIREKDAALYPAFANNPEAMRKSMRTEIERFVEDIFNSNADVMDLLTSTTSFVDANLAQIYGVPAPSTPFQRVNLNSAQRAGLLTRAAFAATHSYKDQTSPIHRGKFVRINLLCGHLADPPANVLAEPPVLDSSMTTRERFSEHRNNPACSVCHDLIDPIGFTLENFDAVGAWRSTEGAGIAIDASAEILFSDIPGVVNGPVEISRALAASPTARECIQKNWFAYANGRRADVGDACAIKRALPNEGETSFKDVVLSQVVTPAFQYRVKEAP